MLPSRGVDTNNKMWWGGQDVRTVQVDPDKQMLLPDVRIRKQHLLHMDPQVSREAKQVPEEGLCQVYPTAEVVRTSGPSSLHLVWTWEKTQNLLRTLCSHVD